MVKLPTIDLDGFMFVDCETTGLDAFKHRILELCYIDGNDEPELLYPGENEQAAFHWSVDPKALEVNKWLDRFPDPNEQPFSENMEWVEFMERANGKTLVGANVRFDALFIMEHMNLHHNGRYTSEPWSYRLFDLQAYAAGVLRFDKPPGLSEIYNMLVGAFDYEITQPDHTAKADTECARDVYIALRDINDQRFGTYPYC